MATRIPLPGAPGEAFLNGLNTGSGMFSRIMQPVMQQRGQEQQWQQHLQNLAIKQQEQERLAQLMPYQVASYQSKAEAGPLNLELLRAKIAHEHAKANKPGAAASPEKVVRQQQLINSHLWSSMPPSSKENLVALGNGLGIRPDALVQGMTSGKSFEDIAEEHGYKREQISEAVPKYLATSGNVKLENERQKKVAELNVLEDRVTNAMAPYIQTFYGKSPQFVADALRGKSIDEQAKYLAGRALQPEMGALRINVMGGNVGQGAIDEIVHAALGKSDIPQSLITPEVYKKMNHYTKKWLNEASQAATESIYGRPGSAQPQKDVKPIDDMSLEEVDAELSRSNY